MSGLFGHAAGSFGPIARDATGLCLAVGMPEVAALATAGADHLRLLQSSLHGLFSASVGTEHYHTAGHRTHPVIVWGVVRPIFVLAMRAR